MAFGHIWAPDTLNHSRSLPTASGTDLQVFLLGCHWLVLPELATLPGLREAQRRFHVSLHLCTQSPCPLHSHPRWARKLTGLPMIATEQCTWSTCCETGISSLKRHSTSWWPSWWPSHLAGNVAQRGYATCPRLHKQPQQMAEVGFEPQPLSSRNHILLHHQAFLSLQLL